MAEPSLDLLQTMMQRALDGIGLLREDVSNLRRRVGRIENAINALRRDHIDSVEAEAARQDVTDRLSERLERLERTGAPPP